MILSAFEWHPTWSSYEWWSDIGTGALGVAAAVFTATATLGVAVRSHLLAKRVADDAKARARQDRDDLAERDKRDSADRYRDQLVRVVEPAVSELVAYGNLLNGLGVLDTAEERTVRAAVISRLTLVEAVARDSDRVVAGTIKSEFWDLHSSQHLKTRVLAAGDYVNHLARLIRGDFDHDELREIVSGTRANHDTEQQRMLDAQMTAYRLAHPEHSESDRTD